MIYQTVNAHLLADPFVGAARVAMAQLRYRGVLHDARSTENTVLSAPTMLIYRGVSFLRHACRPKRTGDVAPGTLRYRGVSH